MKTKSFFLTITAVFVSLSSCTEKDNILSAPTTTSDGNIVCFAQNISKTAIGPEESGIYPIVWAEADSIEISSSDGQTHSAYSLVSIEESGAGIFKSDTPVGGNDRNAIYPASAFKGYDKDGLIIVDLSGLKNQKYAAGLSAADVSSYPLWAKEDQTTPGLFAFTNICGCVMMKLNDYMGSNLMISSVEISSASKSLTGLVKLNPADGSITQCETVDAKSVIVTAPEPVKISGDTPDVNAAGTECFLIALPAGTYPANDLTFSITDANGRVFSKTLGSEMTIAPGIVKKMAKLQFTIYYGTANSVVVNPGSSVSISAEPYYSFHPQFAYQNNRIKSIDDSYFVVEEASASVLWELSEGAGAFAAGSVISDCSYSNGMIQVTAKDIEGNAVVALKDDSGKILWSYHVWVTDTPADLPYTNLNGGIFMDRNLGATNLETVSKTTPALDMLGMYYQHGRKDPFACSLSSWNTVLSQSESITDTNANIAYTIQHPEKRILNTVRPWSWNNYGSFLSCWGATKSFSSADQTPEKYKTEADLPKTVYDPCPAGYKVPEAKYLAFNVKDKAKGSISPTGCLVKYDGTNTTYWPANGYMCQDTDNITASSPSGRRGSVVCVWTASGNTNFSIRFFANSSSYTLQTSESQGRAAAAGVRCMKIPTTQGSGVSINTQLEEPEDETL